MKIKDNELKALLEEVGAEIGALLKTEAETLQKASPGEASAEELDESKDAAPGETSEASAPTDMAPEASAPAPEAPAEEAPPMEAAPEAPAEEAPASQEELQAEYAKLPPEELKAHYMAAKAALMQVMGGEQEQAPPAPAPEASAPAPIAPPAPAMKAEKEMAKSEKAVEEENKEVETLKKQVEGLTKALEIMVGQPLRKAVTSVAFVPKAVEAKSTLSKSEVTDKLRGLTASSKLSKSDRSLINDYYAGAVSIEKIEHLLS